MSECSIWVYYTEAHSSFGMSRAVERLCRGLRCGPAFHFVAGAAAYDVITS